MTDSEPSAPAGSFFFSPDLAANPFPMLAQLRDAGSLMPIPLPPEAGQGTLWLVTQFDQAVRVLKDPARFTVNAAAVDESQGAFGLPREAVEGMAGFFGGRTMVNVDGAAHSRLRGLVAKAFTPRYIESLRPRIQQIADELLDAVAAQGEMDLVADYGFPLPINVISEMLGVPKEDREQVREGSEAIATGSRGQYGQADLAAVRRFGEYVIQLVESKRANPQEDLISRLIQMEEAGDRLDADELYGMVGLLIFAGHETTSNLINIGTLMLLDHPAQLARLKADWGLLPNAIEELLRFNGPVLTPAPRFVAEDTELAGQMLKKGDRLMVALLSANRDAAQFEDPAELAIARELGHHLAFGHGIHYCLGAPLARLEGEIAFRTLFERCPELRLAIPREAVPWRPSLSLRGPASLPVAFTPTT